MHALLYGRILEAIFLSLTRYSDNLNVYASYKKGIKELKKIKRRE